MGRKLNWMLSVDWDTFIPEDPLLDFGHAETLMYATFAWLTRGYAYEVLKRTGEEQTFWQRVEKRTKYKKGPQRPTLFVSDSHAMASAVLNSYEIDKVVLVDAHHDMWPVACEGSYICSDWLRIWLEENRKHRAVWVQPEWSVGMFEIPSDLKKQVKHTLLPKMEKALPTTAPIAIHVCRSASWTPPWFDAAFIRFVEDAGLHRPFKLQQEGWLDPLEERWKGNELENMLAMHKAMQISLEDRFEFDPKTGGYRPKKPKKNPRHKRLYRRTR